MDLQKTGAARVRVILVLDRGATGGVQLADDGTDLRPASSEAQFPKTVIDASTAEWRNVPTEASGSAFLRLHWRAIEPIAATTFYNATITVVDEPGGVELAGDNPKVRPCNIGDIVPGVGKDGEAINIT